MPNDKLDSAAKGEFAPRCVKDLIEERLFERRRDLFTALLLVFMDTTTLSFHGAGGESLGAHGHSKDHRPDLRQMVLAVLLNGEGRPLCAEILAGNTADMTALLPVADRLRKASASAVCALWRTAQRIAPGIAPDAANARRSRTQDVRAVHSGHRQAPCAGRPQSLQASLARRSLYLCRLAAFLHSGEPRSASSTAQGT